MKVDQARLSIGGPGIKSFLAFPAPRSCPRVDAAGGPLFPSPIQPQSHYTDLSTSFSSTLVTTSGPDRCCRMLSPPQSLDLIIAPFVL